MYGVIVYVRQLIIVDVHPDNTESSNQVALFESCLNNWKKIVNPVVRIYLFYLRNPFKGSDHHF